VPGPGEYRPDATEGITRIDDLPRPNISLRSRNYRRRPCPRCGHSAYRNGTARRTLHDLGDTLTGRPRDLVVLHSQHFCSRCRKYFNADTTDLADPGGHYTRRGSCLFSHVLPVERSHVSTVRVGGALGWWSSASSC
jgi:ribosomal protein S27AE